MEIYKVSPIQKNEIQKISIEMINSGIMEEHVFQIMELANKYEGAYDLMVIWFNETDLHERIHIINDLLSEYKEWKNFKNGNKN